MLIGRRSRWHRGFSLIELMITVAILAILIVLVAPAIGDWLLNAQIRTAAESIQNGLQKARTEAVRRNAPAEFVLAANSGWNINLIQGIAHNNFESRVNAEGSSQVVVTTSPAGTTTVTFDGMGRSWGDPATGKNLDGANSAPGSNQMQKICVNLPTSVLPAARSRNLEIDVSLSGAVRMCDPQVTDNTDTRYCPGSPTICKD